MAFTIEEHIEAHKDFCDPSCEFCDKELMSRIDKDDEEAREWWNQCSH